MDLCSLQVKYGNPIYFLPRSPTPCLDKSVFTANKIEHGRRLFQFRPGKRNFSYPVLSSFIVKPLAVKHNGNSSSSSFSDSDDKSIPEDDGSMVQNPSGRNSGNPTPHHKTWDWRDLRATLFASEQAETAYNGTHVDHPASHLEYTPLGMKWAHPISSLETGSVLVATKKLDGIHTFEKTVVLLLRSGSMHHSDFPFGVIINRPLNEKIKLVDPSKPNVSITLPRHYGGPLEAPMFLVKTGEKTEVPGIEELIPGLGYGTRCSLGDAMVLMNKGVLKPQDFRFFGGYVGWRFDDLCREVNSHHWLVAACSANLIFDVASDSSESLWEEILKLMSGY